MPMSVFQIIMPIMNRNLTNTNNLNLMEIMENKLGDTIIILANNHIFKILAITLSNIDGLKLIFDIIKF